MNSNMLSVNILLIHLCYFPGMTVNISLIMLIEKVKMYLWL